MTSGVEELEKVAGVCERIRFSHDNEELRARVLAPVACFLQADKASFRALSTTDGIARPNGVVSLEIPARVDDAYLGRYYALDPARRLLKRRVTKPLLPHPCRQGEWLTERASPAQRLRYREEFRRYRDEFLLPNNFFHHMGFCFKDLEGRLLLFDFQRPAGAPAFSKLDFARAQLVGMYLQADVTRYLHAAPPRCDPVGDSPLSARELEVAGAVARGMSNKEVARTLKISVRTVENHMRSIFTKLGVTTRTRLAAKLHETAAPAARTPKA